MRSFQVLRTVSVLTFLFSFTGCNVSHNIDKLLDTEDDFELCNELFKRVDKQHGNDLDVSKYNSRWEQGCASDSDDSCCLRLAFACDYLNAKRKQR